MAKIVRLTESDLTRIVKLVIQENSNTNSSKIAKKINGEIRNVIRDLEQEGEMCSFEDGHRFYEYVIEEAMETLGLSDDDFSEEVQDLIHHKNYDKIVSRWEKKCD